MTGGIAAYPSPARRSNARWVGRAAILPSAPDAPQALRFLVLTLSFLGLQLVWSCEMSQAAPYLLSLGVSKAGMSIVFLAGPLSGLIVQPLVGVLSDGCRSSLGRRRPFIIGGCAMSSFAVMLLGWAPEVASVVAQTGGKFHSRLTIALAVISIYVIDFSINVVQAMDRSLLVDVIAPELQPAANAWASRMFGVGSVLGFWIGGIDLVWATGGWLGGEQLKVLTIFTSFFLCASHAVTVACVRERVLISRDDDSSRQPGTSSTMKALEDIWTTIRTMPRPIQQVLNVQFFSWLGFFPILFFSTTWIAEIYVKENWGPSDLASAPAEVRESATRAGSRAMLFHSIISLSTSLFLPPFISSMSAMTPSASTPYLSRSPSRGGRTTLSSKLQRWLPSLPLPWLNLPLLWTISNGLFSLLLLSTWFATTVGGASFIIATAGFCWAVTNWAPFAILGELILRLGASSPAMLMTDPNPQEWGPPGLSPILEEASDYEPSVYTKTPTLAPIKTSTANAPWTPPPRHHDDDDDDDQQETLMTPPSATSAYFDTSMDTPERAAFNELRQSPSRERAPRQRESSGPYDYPPNHDPYSSSLSLTEDLGPYASNSTIRLEQTSLQIRHSDDTFERSSDGDSQEDEDDERTDRRGLGLSGVGSTSQRNLAPPQITLGDADEWDVDGDEGDGAASDQAGVILGCHNIYLVLPQFLITALSSIIFALFAPGHSVVAGHGAPVVVAPIPTDDDRDEVITGFARVAVRQATEGAGAPDTLGIIFRVGGVAAAAATYVCWRMYRDRERDRAGRRARGTG